MDNDYLNWLKESKKLFANRLWNHYCETYVLPTEQFGNGRSWPVLVSDTHPRSQIRQEFESWLMTRNCYLVVTERNSSIKGFDDISLMLLLLEFD